MRSLTCLLVCIPLMMGGCARLDEKFTLNADGSGSLHIDLELFPQTVNTLRILKSRHFDKPTFGTSAVLVPLTEEDVRGLADRDGVSVSEARVETTADGGRHIYATIDFKDVSQFALSKAANLFFFKISDYGQDKIEFHAQLPFIVYEGTSDPASAVEYFETRKQDDSWLFFRLQQRGASYKLEVKLPGEITSSNARTSASNTATWSIEADTMEQKDIIQIFPKAVFKPSKLAFSLPVKANPPTPSETNIPIVGQPQDLTQRRFVCVLDSISMNKSVLFKGGEKPVRAEGNVYVQLKVWFAPGIVPMSYSDVTVDEAVSGDTDLKPTDNTLLRRIQNIYADTQQSFQVDLSLGHVELPISSIETLKGSFEVAYASSLKSVAVKDLASWKGKRIDIPELAGYEVFLDDISESHVTMRFPKDTNRALRQVTFRDSQDHIVHWESLGKADNSDAVTYEVKLPEGSSVIFELAVDLKREVVPFEFQHISLEPDKHTGGVVITEE